jgi:mannose-6-phosphate isomerase-like protein (cupin superfamily)
MIHLRWRGRSFEYGHLVKVSCERGSPLGLHTHDYPELFWISQGRCRHRINDTEEVLETGDLVFIRANDRHQLISLNDGRFAMTNLECRRDLIQDMKRRYSKSFAVWFGEKRKLPLRLHLGDNRLERLQQFSMDFASRVPDALQVEGFLLDLARLLVDSRPALTGLANCPESFTRPVDAQNMSPAVAAAI